MKQKFLILLAGALLTVQAVCSQSKSSEQEASIAAFDQSIYGIKYSGTTKQIDITNFSLDDNIELCLYNDALKTINQYWKPEKDGEYFRIVSAFNQKVIAIQYDDVSNRWKIVQCRKGGSDHPDKQLWKIRTLNGMYSLQSKYNDYGLTVSDDRSQLLLKEGEPDRSWKFVLPSGEEIFSREELREDIDFFFRTLEETHPNPYFKTPKDAVLKTMYFLADYAPMNKTEFAMLLAQTNCFFGGHTGRIGWSELQSKITRYTENGGKYFPEITLTDNNSGVLLQDSVFGTVIIATINGISITEILRQMNNANNQENRDARYCSMQMEFSENLIKFCDIGSPFRIVGMNEKGKVDYVLSGLSKQEFDGTRTLRIAAERRDYPLRALFYEEDSIAVLQFNTCVTDRLGDMEAFRKDFIEQTKAKNIRHLFIDITSNGGGNSDNSLNIIKFLNHERLYTPRIFDVTFNMDRYIKTDGDIPKEANCTVDSLNRTCTFHNGIEIEEQKDGFSGNVYLLQSRYTYSAADYLSVLVKHFGLAVIVGEPTGQPLKSDMDMYGFQMPNTRLWFGSAIKYWEDIGIDCPTESLCPDIPIEIGCVIPAEFPKEWLKRIIE